jgi:hypothetical protein
MTNLANTPLLNWIPIKNLQMTATTKHSKKNTTKTLKKSYVIGYYNISIFNCDFLFDLLRICFGSKTNSPLIEQININ